jgi:hypothetical protein
MYWGFMVWWLSVFPYLWDPIASFFVSKPQRKIGCHSEEWLPKLGEASQGQPVLRSHDAERGADLSGLVPDRGGHATDALHVFFIVDCEACGPNLCEFPPESNVCGDRLGCHLFKVQAIEDVVEVALRQPRSEGLADGRAVDGPGGANLLDDAH